MPLRILKFRLIVLGTLLVFALATLTQSALSEGAGLAQLLDFSYETNQLLKVTFLDVGQGDAIYVETPDGVQMLIDGGPDVSVLRELAQAMPFLDRTLDVVIATHSDKDHIGGLVDVLERYQVDLIIQTESNNDTDVSTAFDLAAREEGAEEVFARAGQELKLGASTTLRIFSPASDTTGREGNSSSVVVQIKYGEIEFMLTGDAPSGIEDYLAKTYGDELESEVLKLGHHGSRTSTSELFLNTVKPKYAIVSAGAGNRYGHPHRDVVARVLNNNIELLSTASDGSITFWSDGREVW